MPGLSVPSLLKVSVPSLLLLLLVRCCCCCLPAPRLTQGICLSLARPIKGLLRRELRALPGALHFPRMPKPSRCCTDLLPRVSRCRSPTRPHACNTMRAPPSLLPPKVLATAKVQRDKEQHPVCASLCVRSKDPNGLFTDSPRSPSKVQRVNLKFPGAKASFSQLPGRLRKLLRAGRRDCAGLNFD
ncbi:hypothetical protein BCV69DRAFT_205239 [Microstroma glucosiphilum]|uniref:Secreted protein n=1 Tax=Pseudomicrostroma glucosiphilum TaxID=1684307 RepID=A0A316U637_9BASI|nr:hypothetical protein BCV69DRAFT_205239 [Pseudomicrostroma glucosiphilum]PWN20294.1 hypothetical protein BCV69DRAFT_205239 [Pseudomicrostroma glucosiphilum]